MIGIRDISKVFGEGTVNENHAISGLSLSINEGDFITVIGSNGAGKSTLFNMIAGTYFPTSGSISINGRDITREPEFKRARYIGRIFQNPLLGTAANMTIEQNMLLSMKKGFKSLRVSLNDAKRALFTEELALLDMNLETRLKDRVALLSGGQRQSMTLLMMVSSRPSLILLDEHTAALDPKNAAIVLSLTKKFIEEYGLTAMMITHNMSQAIEYGNRLLMMDKGEIIFDVSGEEKKKLTVQKLVEKFHEIRNEDFGNDKALLSD
jgi:putative tryptophan/tyrosine transport system ATP-binding protein